MDKSLRGPGNDRATGVAVDSSGNVIVTGYSGYSAGNPSATNSYDYVTVKYSSDGMTLWTNRYDGPGNNQDYPRAVVVDAGDNVIVTGYSTGSGSGYDYATVAYSRVGLPLWTNLYNGSLNANDAAAALVVNKAGDVFVTGYSYRYGSGADWTTIRYSSAGADVTALAIAYTTTNTVAVYWPSPSTGFILHQNTNLTTTNWTPVGTTPSNDGTTKTVIVNPPIGNTFYRLISP